MFDLEGMENREFIWDRQDCFALVWDFYKVNFGIELQNWARPVDWRADRHDIIRKAIDAEGMELIANWKVKDLRPGDIMCMAVGERNPNHLALYIGDNKILHHLYGNLSTITPMEGRWVHATCFLARHPKVPDLREEAPSVPIEERLRARHFRQS